MARGRPEGAKSTRAVRFGDLKELMTDNQVILVGSTWLKQLEGLHNVEFQDPNKPVVKTIPQPEKLEAATPKEAQESVEEQVSVPEPEQL